MAYELEGNPSGVGRYLEGLLGGLLETDEAGEWHLFAKGDPFDHPLFGAEGRGGARIVAHFDRRPAARPIAWEQTRLPGLLRRARVDFVFSPGYSLPPFVAVPRMVTLHDLSFEHLPREFGWRERFRRRALARVAARRAERVLVDTRAIALDLARTYRLDASKIGVVPLSVDPRFFDAARHQHDGDRPDDDHRSQHDGGIADESKPEERLRALGIRGPYLLFLATLLPRRRPDLVLDAFSALARDRPDLQLVLAGQNRLRDPGALERWCEQTGAGERVVRLDYVPEPDLPALYAGAEASFYLSSYEGYGLPPLESLAAGTPAIVSAGLALDDLWPEYPYRAELERDSVIATSRRLLAEPDRARRVVEEGRRRLADLDWATCAELFRQQVEIAFAARATGPRAFREGRP